MKERELAQHILTQVPGSVASFAFFGHSARGGVGVAPSGPGRRVLPSPCEPRRRPPVEMPVDKDVSVGTCDNL